MVESVPENIEFAKEEQRIFETWETNDTFQKCLQQSANKPKYTFYDGPPFATGLPHYGHLLTGTIKDVVTRWAHQSGFHVDRRFGWDTHGLPIEFEIDKTLNIQGPEDVAKMGIAAYNAECRKIVMRYASEWRRVVHRMGRWIDFDNDYKTMYPTFMESVWWVFKQLFEKQLVYRGVKVMPYSTKCNTPLSNFESGQNYKEVTDPAVIVTFPLVDEPEVSLVAWTTTPWTLPSNLALCVNPKSTYVKIKCVKTGKFYIAMESRLSALFKKAADYEIVDKFVGSSLNGKRYQPLFDYFVEKMSPRGAYQVLNDDYVSEESGVGIVHQAPYFGEDDYRVCLANNVISRDGDIVCPVDPSGRFTSEVTHFAGQYVKDADKEIIKYLKNNGRLFSSGSIQHNYPFCWRSDTPLIYRAVPSWFVRVEQMSGKLLENNQKTYWVPDFVKEKRFGNWLRDARDWAISRNRYWGTPIPLWLSDDGQEIVCVGSIEELYQLSGVKVTDLHRETIDSIEIPSKQGKGMLKRINEVFDCWFESGSMPYAQKHYPFENKETFEQNFPADFIAEGIDQTRGWFYTLLVISTALFDKAPFKNLIVNGLVLAADGQKMSKRKKNYPDPMEIINKYGADALRLYLINSPVVRSENLRFREEGVRDILKDGFLPWYNAYRFLIQNVQLYIQNQNVSSLQFVFANEIKSDNLMDRWILSSTQSLILFVKQEMAAYRLYTVTPRLVKFIENLTNWYVRMNRRRLKGENGEKDWLNALETLAHVLISMCVLMAPFTPFLTEFIFKNLKKLFKDRSDEESVHMVMLPEVRESYIDQQVEKRVGYMQTIVEIGRIVRDRRTLPLKYPLPSIIVICKEQSILDEVKILEQYILDELNVRQLILTTEKERYGVTLKAEPNIKALGLRLRNKSKDIAAAIRNWNESDIQSYQNDPTKFELNGEHLQAGEVNISYKFSEQSTEQSSRYEAHGEGVFLVLLDTQADEQMLEEGVAREVINRIQKLRKKAQLTPTDPIKVYFNVPDQTDLNNVIKARSQYIESNIKVPFLRYPLPEGVSPLISESQDLKETILEMSILKISGDQN